MSKYAKGTQAQLDVAKDDATLLPFDTVFLTDKKETSDYHMPDRVLCIRTNEGISDHISVAFYTEDTHKLFHADTSDLLPAKQPKQKKPKAWQNGTQEQLDAAMDNAKLIPKKTYFLSNYGKTKGKVVYRVDNQLNDSSGVYMLANSDCSVDFHAAEDLVVISDD